MKHPWLKTLEKIATNHSLTKVFADFVTVTSCTLSFFQREDEYVRVMKQYTRTQVNLFVEAFGQLILDMDNRPFEDVLGPVYMEVHSNVSKQARGEFYTPWSISCLMAEMTCPEPKAGEITTFNDPAVGSGGMPLAFAKTWVERGFDLLNVQMVLQDINKLAVDMCFINMTLWGIPAVVLLGDTLKEEVLEAHHTIFWTQARPYMPEDGLARVAKFTREFLALLEPRIQAEQGSQGTEKTAATPVVESAAVTPCTAAGRGRQGPSKVLKVIQGGLFD